MKYINGIKLYNEKEVASLLEMHANTIGTYRRNGILKATRIGGSYYIPESALNEYLNGRIMFQGKRPDLTPEQPTETDEKTVNK